MKIQRACGALIKENKILMVLHRHNGIEYWTLPGGEIEKHETPEQATEREFYEETNIKVEVIKFAFDEYLDNGNTCRGFFVKELFSNQTAILGHDPEDANIAKEERMLQDIQWFDLTEKRNDKQVSKILMQIKNNDI
jgi:8-oxo-dGTP diphosphatase